MYRLSYTGLHSSRLTLAIRQTKKSQLFARRVCHWPSAVRSAGCVDAFPQSPSRITVNMGTKRKKSSVAGMSSDLANGDSFIIKLPPILPPPKQVSSGASKPAPPKPTRQPSRRGKVDTNPDHNADIIDGKEALRASPDAEGKGEAFKPEKVNGRPKAPRRTTSKKAQNYEESESSLSDLEEPVTPPPKKLKKNPTKSSIAAKKASDEIKAFKAEQAALKATTTPIKKEDDDGTFRPDPDGDDALAAEDIDTEKKEAARPPPVNSEYLPLPWKGRLGYVSFRQNAGIDKLF
jgi:UV DNA damage endonuclease